jgi:hypothetical protein
MATWPTAPFPQTPQRAGYEESEVDSVLRSNMGYGPAKLRQRTTAVLYNSTQVFTITGADKVIFETFYSNNKSISFDWDNTLGLGTQSYRFISPPRYQEVTCNVWRMQAQLERLP